MLSASPRVAGELGHYRDGRPLNYDSDTTTFDVGGTPVTAEVVRAYDRAAQISWASGEMRYASVALLETLGTKGPQQRGADSMPPDEPFLARLAWAGYVTMWWSVLAAFVGFFGPFAVAMGNQSNPVLRTLLLLVLLVLLVLFPLGAIGTVVGLALWLVGLIGQRLGKERV